MEPLKSPTRKVLPHVSHLHPTEFDLGAKELPQLNARKQTLIKEPEIEGEGFLQCCGTGPTTLTKSLPMEEISDCGALI